MSDTSITEIKERILRLTKFRKQIIDLKLKWEDELLSYVVDASNETLENEIERNLSLMRKVEQKVLLRHLKELEEILGLK